jgi:hypothetical protein
MLNVLVTEVVLQRARIDALIGQLEPGRVSEHVWMYLERHLSDFAQPRDHSPKTNGTHGRSPFAHEHIAGWLLLALQSTQSTEFGAGIAQTHVGVIAWSRTGDPDLGDWGPPEVLVRTGVIPDEFEAGGGVE